MNTEPPVIQNTFEFLLRQQRKGNLLTDLVRIITEKTGLVPFDQ